jgi:hypothetical protein
MATVQTSNVSSKATPAFAFLSKPPPPRKKVPTVPLPELPTTAPARRESFSAIFSWASNVQPGSPGSPGTPRSPLQSFSINVHNNMESSPRRVSVSVTPNASKRQDYIPSSGKLLPAEDRPVGLAGLGYTSVFIDLPKTPATPSPPQKFAPEPEEKENRAPTPGPRRRGTMRRLRSLSFLPGRSRPRANTQPTSPQFELLTSLRSPTSPCSPEGSPKIVSAAFCERKDPKFAYLRPSKSKIPSPPTLSHEIALMQFTGGGSKEDNAKALMEARARSALPTGASKNSLAVGGAYRDGQGGFWLDRDEALEYAHLLEKKGDANAKVAKWIAFQADQENDGVEDAALALETLAIERKASATTESSFDLAKIVRPADEDITMASIPPSVAVPPSPSSPMAASPVATSPKAARRISPPLLNLPSRPRSHIRHHLSGKAAYFLLDLQAFSVPTSPTSPKSPKSPRIRALLANPQSQASSTAGGPCRRRRAVKPAPLMLTTSELGRPRHMEHVELEMERSMDVDVDIAKEEFFADSFEPEPMLVSTFDDHVEDAFATTGPLRLVRKKVSMKFGALLARK